MAKVKLAGSKKGKPTPAADIKAAVPCLILIFGGLIFVLLILYFSMQSVK